MVYGNLSVTPPRLPEPPVEFGRDPLVTSSYVVDLVRSLEVFINQQQSTDALEELETISWFMGQ